MLAYPVGRLRLQLVHQVHRHLSEFRLTLPYSDQNGDICLPTDAELYREFMLRSKLDSRVSLLNPIILITYAATVGLSVILVVLLNLLPRATMQSVQYLSLAA